MKKGNNGQVKILDKKYYVDLQQILGSGVCGSVYFGWMIPERFLAIKSILITAKFEISDSILREINLLRKLNHPNIVKFIDAKKTKDYMYLITEFCNEGSLEDHVLKQQLSENDVLNYFRQICKAFKVLHENNILHGDVKPNNILLHNQQCKLADFGVSKSIDSNHENTTLRGTPAYMAPQILSNQPYTRKSDIWSLGITLYFMLFQRLPWDQQQCSNQNKLWKFITSQYNPESFFKNLSSAISEFMLNLLKRMMVVEEENRISWEELFDVVIGKEEIEKDNKQQKEALLQKNNENQGEQNDVITRQTLDLRKQDNEDETQDDIYQNVYEMMNRYHYLNEQILKAKMARNQLENEVQRANFFEYVAKQVEEQRKRIENMPGGLYEQCIFLLRKRSIISYRNLQYMTTFKENKSGNIEINEELWKAFHSQIDSFQEPQVFSLKGVQLQLFVREINSSKNIGIGQT